MRIYKLVMGMSARVSVSQWGWWLWDLLRNPTEEGKKLFKWREVLVLMDRSLLPEGGVPNRQ